jgi:hypothetical protein
MLNGKNYDSIIKKFSTVMTELSLLIERKAKERAKLTEQVQVIEEKRDACIDESKKAGNTLNKLQEIFGGFESNG